VSWTHGVTKTTLALSAGATLLVGLITFTLSVRWSDAGAIARGDGLGYFLYARSLVVDLDTDITREIEEIQRHFHPAATTSVDNPTAAPGTGRLTLPWPIGSGAVMAPFYASGWAVENAVARVQGRPPDSYGLIPQFAFGIGSLVYGWLGFWCTYLCCATIAPRGVAGLATLAISLGGPVVYYVFVAPSMAHAASFGLVGLLLLLWWRMWHGEVRPGPLALLGFVFGLLVTVRYQNVLFGILPAALMIAHLRRAKLADWVRVAAIGALAFAGPVAGQALHYVSVHGAAGGVTVRSATVVEAEANAVDVGSPRFLDVLFSCQHGAFYWAPVLAIAVGGLAWAARRRTWARLFLLTFFAHVYLVGGLQGIQNWSGGHAFGMRYLTECGALLSVGLAFAVARSPRRWLVGWAVGLGALVVWNGALIGAYTLKQISTLECVTFAEMVQGVGRMLARSTPGAP
jgi:hypothetical protein